MVQVAAALLFVAAFGFGLTVILAMLKTNGASILSALAGEGAFPLSTQLESTPAFRLTAQRRTTIMREGTWAKSAAHNGAKLSRAAA